MARIKTTKIVMLEWAIDRIWPRISDCPEKVPEWVDHIHNNDEFSLSDIKQFLFYRLEQANQRQKTVESKLVSLLALTIALTTLIAGAITFVATFGTIDESIKSYVIIAAFVIAYISLQLTHALFRAVSGLSRREYMQITPKDIVPLQDERGEEYQIRIYNILLNQISRNDWVVNRIVDDMTLAHLAMKNAIIATFAIIPLAILILIVRIG